jgi:hypothetical protein
MISSLVKAKTYISRAEALLAEATKKKHAASNLLVLKDLLVAVDSLVKSIEELENARG